MQQLIELPWPPSVNHYWRQFNGRTILSNAGREYRTNVLALLLPKRYKPLEGSLSVTICACPPDKRRRDLDNILKAVLDAMQYAGVYKDDSQVDVLAILRGATDTVGHGTLLITVTHLGKD